MPTHPRAATLLAERAARRAPAELVDVVAEVARETWGATAAALLLATHEQTELVAVPDAGQAVPIDDGPAGRCFTLGGPVADDETTWAPVTHRGERFGVLGAVTPTPLRAAELAELVALADAVALHLAADRGASDVIEIGRRTQEMSVSAELITSLVPPLTYVDDRVSLAAVMEPSYDAGGDALDYSVDGGVVRAMILDATGHGFLASQVSAVGVAAYRSARRAGQDLLGTWAVMDRFVGDAGDGTRYATAVLVELRLDTGRLTWITAGHDSPVILRADGQVQVLEGDPAPPLGTGLGGEPTPAEEFLEPGDVMMLHTDGLTEARGLDGQMLGLDGFLEALRDGLGRGGLLAERLRRLRLDLLARDDAWLSNDATAVLVEWTGPQA